MVSTQEHSYIFLKCWDESPLIHFCHFFSFDLLLLLFLICIILPKQIWNLNVSIWRRQKMSPEFKYIIRKNITQNYECTIKQEKWQKISAIFLHLLFSRMGIKDTSYAIMFRLWFTICAIRLACRFNLRGIHKCQLIWPSAIIISNKYTVKTSYSLEKS